MCPITDELFSYIIDYKLPHFVCLHFLASKTKDCDLKTCVQTKLEGNFH